MPLRPTDTDILADICRSIALRNYGFLYVDRVSDDIRSKYESADKRPLKASSLSRADIKKSLESIASDEYAELQRLRTGAYYYNPFSTGNDQDIASELTAMFRQQLVVTSEELRSRFDLAVDDVDFFAEELVNDDRKWLRRIAAGERNYYTIGPHLKDEAGGAGVDARLRERATATYGKLSHDQLEKEINVAATADVIRYLEREDYIIDLDGEYLVKEAIPEFSEHLAAEVEDNVATTFEESKYVLPDAEFSQVVENEVRERSGVLSQARAVRGDILSNTEDTLTENLGLETDGPVVVQREEFDTYVDRRAAEIKREVETSGERLATESDFHDVGHPMVEDVHVGTAEQANEYTRDAIREQFDELVNDDFHVEREE